MRARTTITVDDELFDLPPPSHDVPNVAKGPVQMPETQVLLPRAHQPEPRVFEALFDLPPPDATEGASGAALRPVAIVDSELRRVRGSFADNAG